MTPERIVLVVTVAIFTLVAAVCDLRTKKLPNWLTVPSFAAALLFHAGTGWWHGGLSGVGQSLLFALGGFATGFGILLVLWLIGGGGAGDVKLMGALGAWLGAEATLYVFLVSTVMVLICSVGTLSYQMIVRGMGYTKRRYLTPADATSNQRRQLNEMQAKTRRRLMPYGVPVALATWALLAWAVLAAHVAQLPG